MNNTDKDPYLLQDWGMVVTQEPYRAPEAGPCRLTGRVFGNPRFPEGEQITTSRLICAVTDDVVQTTNSFYRLGAPNAEYEKLFPHARARLLNALKKQCDVK